MFKHLLTLITDAPYIAALNLTEGSETRLKKKEKIPLNGEVSNVDLACL